MYIEKILSTRYGKLSNKLFHSFVKKKKRSFYNPLLFCKEMNLNPIQMKLFWWIWLKLMPSSFHTTQGIKKCIDHWLFASMEERKYVIDMARTFPGTNAFDCIHQKSTEALEWMSVHWLFNYCLNSKNKEI